MEDTLSIDGWVIILYEIFRSSYDLKISVERLYQIPDPRCKINLF